MTDDNDSRLNNYFDRTRASKLKIKVKYGL